MTGPSRGRRKNEEEAMRSSRMALLLAGLVLATTAQAQTKNNGPGVTDSEIKIGQSAPFSGPASAFGIYSRVEDAYFKSSERQGRPRRPQDQVHPARQRLQPAQGARGLAQARRGRQRAGRGRHRRHADQLGDTEIPQRQEGATAPDLGRRQQVQRPQAVSLDGAVLSAVRSRGRGLRQVCAEGADQSEDRHPLRERRLR